MRYYVNSYYNHEPDAEGHTIDYVHIGVATKEDEERDGDNWIGRCDAFRFNIYDSLEEAITNASYIPNKIQFVELSAEDDVIAQRIVNRLMHDKEYLTRFGYPSEQIES